MDDMKTAGTRFSLKQLLLATAALAVPMALLSQYWAGVNNTVDERTIPFAEAGPVRQGLLVVGMILTLGLFLAFLVLLVRRKLYWGVMLFALGLAVSIVSLGQVIQANIVHPARGNPSAAIHNDAAAITALAVARYCERTKAWPARWDDLNSDLVAVMDEVRSGHAALVTTANPLARKEEISVEDSQSILVRLPDLGTLSPDELPQLVDVDFDRSIVPLSKENWIEFSGIRPHRPSYNTYRIEFGKLIETLSKIAASESQKN